MKSNHPVALLSVLLLATLAAPTSAAVSYSTATWMTDMGVLLDNHTLLDITVPGTHDTLTYDLSTTVAVNTNSMDKTLAWILHNFHNMSGIGEYIREQAQSQNLSITQQLDAGVRFLDVRTTFSAPYDKPSTYKPYDWYSVHLVESLNSLWSYVSEVVAWLDAHPSEIVTMWVSQHGSTCANQYPGTSASDLQSMFSRLVSVLGEARLLSTPLNTTTIGDMRARKQQVALFVSSYANVVGPNGTSLAVDACEYLDNRLGPGVENETASGIQLLSEFRDGATYKAADKAANKFWLRSISGNPPSEQETDAFFLKFILKGNKDLEKKCAKAFNNPDMTYCPDSLLAAAQLRNFYTQVQLEAAVLDPNTYTLPMAFYGDALGVGGTLRTGVNTSFASGDDEPAYSYTSTIVLYNLHKLSAGGAAGCSADPHCSALSQLVDADRKRHPLKRWDDPEHGRHTAWP